jgi:2',3'-cyclic-nucleotide 2'-phosphodiesterase (5'-nucleotidase family)
VLQTTTMALVVCGLTAGVQAAPTISYFYAFQAVGHGLTENPHILSQAIVAYFPANDTTYGTLAARRLLPNTTYGVLIEGDQGGQSDPVAFTTDSHGRGSYSTNFLQDGATGAHVTIYIWDGDVETIDIVTPDEARAEGVLFGTFN